MKNKEFLNGNTHISTEADANKSSRPIPEEPGVLGDIDELIFPDDEPYYISER